MDKRAAPEHGERVPYVIAYEAGPKSRLIDNIVSPEDFMNDRCVDEFGFLILGRCNCTRHITLQNNSFPSWRVFSISLEPVRSRLVVPMKDLDAWYKAMPRVVRTIKYGQNDTLVRLF
jgi:hypothetical protein